MKKPLDSKSAAGIAAIAILPASVIVLIAPLIISAKLYPETAIGAQGLLSVRKYCLVFIFSHTAAMLLIPVLLWGYTTFYKALTHEEYMRSKTKIIVSVAFMLLYIIIFPKVSQFDVLAINNGYYKYPLFQATMLCRDINRDLKEDETITYDTDIVELKTTNVQYKVSERRGKYHYKSKTISNFEYGIYDKNGELLGQISRADHSALSNGLFKYLPHRIETYMNSGLIKSIDGKETAASAPIEIELVFDYEAGVLRRELLCDDEELLPDMVLAITMDGEYTIGPRINGLTEIAYKPMIPGHFEAWAELRVKNKPSEVISNVIVYDQTEYVD